MKTIITTTITTVEDEQEVSKPKKSGLYRYSVSKGKHVALEDMHPCHLFHSLKKDMEGLSAEEVLGNIYFKTMFKLLSTAELE